MTVTIVADDLAGACDAGTLFAGKSPVPVAVWPDPAVAAPVSVVDTESRDLEAAEASRRVRRAIGPGARAGATVWFKKIDSTLRGHAGAQLAALVRGSRSPAARRQSGAAGRAGRGVLAPPDGGRGEAATAAAEVGAEAARLLAAEPFDLVVVTGGETAVALYRALGATRLDLVGAPQPGLALGWLGMPGRADLAMLTKAGGFGPPNLFVSLAREAGA